MFEEVCVICEKGPARETERERRLTIDGEEFILPNDKYMFCPNCGEEYYTGEQATEADRRLKEALAAR